MLLLALAAPVHAQKYTLTWLPSLPAPYTGVIAGNMNNGGTIIGSVHDYTGGKDRAFMYTVLGGIKDLNAPGVLWKELVGGNVVNGCIASTAMGINDANQIVGTAMDINGLNRGFIFDVLLNEFKLLPSPWTQATAINELGVVLGNVTGTTGGGAVYTPWDNRTVNLGFFCNPGDINDAGYIVGTQGNFLAPKPPINGLGPYSYDAAVPKIIPNHGLYRINIHNLICGIRSTQGTGKNAIPGGAIIWNDAAIPPEITLATGSGNVAAQGINDLDDVAFCDGKRAFLYQATGTTLSLELPLVVNADTEWGKASYLYPRGITNSGQITGRAYFQSTKTAVGFHKSFLLTPIVN